MSFFKHFGRNTCGATRAPVPLPHGVANLTEIDWTNLCELDVYSDHGVHHHWYHECQTGKDRSDVDLGQPHNLPQPFELSDLPRPFELPDLPRPFELSDRRQTRRRWSVEPSANDATQVASIEDINPHELVSPLPDFDFSNRKSTASPISESSESPIAEPFSEPTTVIGQSPNMVAQKSNRRPSLIHHAPNQRSKTPDFLPQLSRIGKDSSENLLTSPAYIVEALRERVNDLNQKWMDKLDLHHRSNPKLVLSMPFEKGIQSLQDFYRGTLPRTFEDAFALMHVAHACAWIYHEEDELDFWRTLFLDILQWPYAIATNEDTQLFLEVAFQLWTVPDWSIAEALEHSKAFQSTFHCSVPDIYAELENTSSFCFNYSRQSTAQSFDPPVAPPTISPIGLDIIGLLSLRNLLKEGQVISVCKRCLDGKLLLSMEIVLIFLELTMYSCRVFKYLCT